MKNFQKYSTLAYIYYGADLFSHNLKNNGKIHGISHIDTSFLNKIAELMPEYVTYVDSFGNGLGYYLTPAGMNYVESHAGILKKIELFASDYPYISSFMLGIIGGFVAVGIDKMF